MHLTTGGYALGAAAVVMGATNAQVGFVGASMAFVLSLVFFMLARSWGQQALKTKDANYFLADYRLTDERDLQWIEWFSHVEPRAALFLQARRPNREFTSRDFLHLYVTKAADEIDAAFAPPYSGDSEARFLDLDVRRQRERRALASGSNCG